IRPAEYDSKEYYDVENTVTQTEKSSIQRMLRPLIEKQQKLLIENNKNEFKQVRLYHSDNKKSMTHKIEEIQAEMNPVRRDITYHRGVAHKYDIKVGEWL